MKIILTFLLVTFTTHHFAFAQAIQAAPTAKATPAVPASQVTINDAKPNSITQIIKEVKFIETEFDFGKIKQGIPVTHNFVFQNNEKSIPIVIADVKTSCGCTKPEYPKQPIMQGQKNQINIGFNAAAEGRFQKTIFVTIDGENRPRELKIKGEVIL